MTSLYLLVARLCDYKTKTQTTHQQIITLSRKELPHTSVTEECLEALVAEGLLQRKGMRGYMLTSPCSERAIPSSETLSRMILVYLTACWDTPMEYEALRAMLMRSLRIHPHHVQDDERFDHSLESAVEKLHAEMFIQHQNSGWGLTTSGHQEAYLLQGKNLTLWWIECHAEEIFKTAPPYVWKRLSARDKYQYDAREIVEDYITALVSRDTFREKITRGEEIRVHNFRQFCVQHYQGMMRKASIDGHLRTVFPHYKTRKEQKGTYTPVSGGADVVHNVELSSYGGVEQVDRITAEDVVLALDLYRKMTTHIDHKASGQVDDMMTRLYRGDSIAKITQDTESSRVVVSSVIGTMRQALRSVTATED